MLYSPMPDNLIIEKLAEFVAFISYEDELPTYSRVLSSVDYDMPFVEDDRFNMVVLECDNSACLVLLDNENKSKTYIKTKRAIEDYGLELKKIYLCGGHIINSLYKNIYKKIENYVINNSVSAFNQIIYDAILKNTANINILAQPESYGRITFEINDQCIAYKNIKFIDFLQMTNAFYSSINPANKDQPSFSVKSECNASVIHTILVGGLSRKFMLRWLSCPSHSGGYDITIRINAINAQALDFRSLGYDVAAINTFDKISRFDEGLFFVCGSVNSGKTTALGAFGSRYLDNHNQRKKLVTLEDPVEVFIPNSHSTSVYQSMNSKDKSKDDIWLDNASSMMRRAPHAIIVGEIRNKLVASQCIRFALSGHLTMTTIHAADPFQALRLLATTYDVELSTLCLPKVLRAIVAQKLVPTLCPDCAVNFDTFKTQLPDYMIENFIAAFDGKTEQLKFENISSKCKTCEGLGSVGRMPIYEIFIPSKSTIEYILKNDLYNAEQAWHESLNDDGVSGVSFAIRAKALALSQHLCAYHAYTKVMSS